MRQVGGIVNRKRVSLSFRACNCACRRRILHRVANDFDQIRADKFLHITQCTGFPSDRVRPLDGFLSTVLGLIYKNVGKAVSLSSAIGNFKRMELSELADGLIFLAPPAFNFILMQMNELG